MSSPSFSRAWSEVDLDRTERSLEREIRRESSIPPKDKKLARLRLKGEHVLHSKHVLLAVVILNLVDCALVLGELILDIHFIIELRDEREAFSQQFVDKMQARYPNNLKRHNIDNMNLLYEQLYLAECYWPNGTHARVDVITTTATTTYITRFDNQTGRSRRNSDVETSVVENRLNNTMELNNTGSHGNDNRVYQGDGHPDTHHREHSVLENVAHGMHKASITILGILFVENIAKVVCMGKNFLVKKLEVFDAVVVIISFIVDIKLLKGLMEYKIQDVVLILTFLLPWRVIRVVNSLIVAVLDHEHFHLKMLYQEKKRISAELNDLKLQERGWDSHLQKIEKFCVSEGIPKWKIRQHTAMGRKQSTVTTLASLALNGFLKGLMFTPADKIRFERSLYMSSLANVINDNQTTGLGSISEREDKEKHDTSNDVTARLTRVQSSALSRVQSAAESDLYYLADDHSLVERQENGSAVDRLSVRYHRQPEHGIKKSSSRVTFKDVIYEHREHRPLLFTQGSVTSTYEDSRSHLSDSHVRLNKFEEK